MASRQRIYWSLVGRYLLVFAPLTGVGLLLGLIAFQPGLRAMFGVAALSFGLACAGVLIAAYLSARQLALPVDSIRRALQQIAAGNYERRILVEERHLVEQLVGALDEMREHLRTRFTELQGSRDQLRTVLDSMIEGVIAIDHGQRVLLVNESACRLFRFQEASALGRPLWELVRNPQLQQWTSQALTQAEPVGGELELLAPVWRVLAVRAAGLPAQAQRGAVVVVSDVSQIKRLENVRQEFVANASHELKTPLASIKACVETLLDGAIDDPEHRTRFLTVVNDQADRLDKLVRDLLALTRIESEGVKRNLAPLDACAVVAACVERHRQAAVRKQMALVVEIPDSPVQVLGDDESLEQILDNLLDNALNYTNAGGTVTVRLREGGATCLLEVEDTGIGIPHSQIARIFERFYRVDRARSRELGGTGLGLSIVKHLVQSLGGTVNVSSWLGRGSRFTVSLRAAPADLTTDGTPPPADGPPTP